MGSLPAPSRLHWTVAAGLLGLAIILRVMLFQGYRDSDPRDYAILADDLARGRLQIDAYDGPAIFPLRYGLYAPTALLIRTFGLSEITIAAFPFLISIANCVLAYALSRRLFGPLAGLIGLAALAVLPIDIAMASLLYPDPPAAFWANLGIAALVFSGSPVSASAGILAGLCFGISWLTKESVVYLAPLVAIFFCGWVRAPPRRALRTSLYVGGASLCIVAGEAAIYKATVGDWLFHFHALERNYAQTAVWFFDQSSPLFGWPEGGYHKALAKRLLLAGPKAVAMSFSGLPIIALIAIVWAIVTKDRRFITPAVWFMFLLAMFNFGSSSVTSYKPLPLFERYLYPLLLPAIVLTSGLLTVTLKEKSHMRSAQFGAATVVLIYLASCALGAARLTSRPVQMVRDAMTKIGPTDVLFTDYRTAASFVFLRTGSLRAADTTTIAYEQLRPDDMPARSYVFIHSTKVASMAQVDGYRSPDFVHSPPQTWRRIWSAPGGMLFYISN